MLKVGLIVRKKMENYVKKFCFIYRRRKRQLIAHLCTLEKFLPILDLVKFSRKGLFFKETRAPFAISLRLYMNEMMLRFDNLMRNFFVHSPFNLIKY